MTAPQPSSTEQIPVENLQVQTPQQVPVEATSPPQGPVSDPQPDPGVDPENRVLTQSETKNLFRGLPLDGSQAPSTPDEKQQATDAAAFFDTLPAQPIASPEQMPAQPPGVVQVPVTQVPAQAVPGQVPLASPDQIAAMAEAGAQIQPQAPLAPAQTPQVPQVQLTPNETALQAQMQGMATQIQNLTGQLHAAQASPQTAQVSPQTAQVPVPGQTPPQFDLNVPPQYMNALNHEDGAVRQQALSAVLNASAQVVYQKTMADMESRFAQIPSIVQPIMDAQTRKERISSDMYGSYPELSNMPDQVAAVATQLAATGLFQAENWNPEYRDAIAERLSPLVPGLGQKVQANRAQRMAVQVASSPLTPSGAFAPQLPQAQVQPSNGNLAPGQVVGGVHVQPQVAVAPVLIRDQNGNYVQAPMQSQHVVGGPQVRPGTGVPLDPQMQDLWGTLGYN